MYSNGNHRHLKWALIKLRTRNKCLSWGRAMPSKISCSATTIDARYNQCHLTNALESFMRAGDESCALFFWAPLYFSFVCQRRISSAIECHLLANVVCQRISSASKCRLLANIVCWRMSSACDYRLLANIAFTAVLYAAYRAHYLSAITAGIL